jgi:hypothetical protein
MFNRRVEPRGLNNAEVIALALTALWIAGIALFFFTAGRGEAPGGADALRTIMIVIAIFMPIAMIWVAATAVSSAKFMREESARLQSAIDVMRQSYVAQQQMVSTGVRPSSERRLNLMAETKKQTDQALATFSSTRSAATSTPGGPDGLIDATPEADQHSLALGTTAEELADPISVADFITAMNFPETADDKVGFRALRRALEDRRSSQLIQASQDVLTFLSQEGIYMDDLIPDQARPDVWRRFASGERGRTVASLGGIRDRSSLALAAARMRHDHIFRDTAHHFLRKFDQVFSEFEKNASDQDIALLANTRTARAFMLLGRVTGTFD